MEAYKVWATLNLKGDALKKMEQFLSLTMKATAAVQKLNLVMRPKLNMFYYMAANLREINPQLSQMARNINKIELASRKASRVFGSRGIEKFGSSIAAGLGLANPYVMGGLGVAALMKSGWQQSGEYSRSMGQLAAMGYSNDQLAFARNFTSQAKPGISQVSQLKAFVDAQMATQSFSMAKELAPIIAQNTFTSQALYGGMSHKQVQDAIRSAEIIGGSDHKKVAAALTSVLQMTALSGGSLMPSEQRTFLKRSAGASSSLTSLGYLGLEPIIQELGGSVAGTAFQTGVQQLIASHMTTQQARDLTNLGLMSPATYDPSGRRVMSKYGSFKYGDQLKQDPFLFLTQTLLPAYAKKGINSTSEIQSRIQYDFNRTFANELIIMLKNMDKIIRERNLIQGLPADKKLSGIGFSQQPGAELRITEAWHSFSKSIGDLTSPAYISGLNAISAILENLANFIGKNKSILQGSFSEAFKVLFPNANYFMSSVSAFGKVDVTKGSLKSDDRPIIVHSIMDGQKVGYGVANKMGSALWGHQVVQHGTTGVNPLQGFSTAVNGVF